MIKKHVMKTMWRYIIGSIALIISVGLDILYPIVVMNIIDDVIIAGHMENLKWNILLMIIIGIGRALSQYVKEILYDLAGCNVAESTRKDLLGHMQGLSKRYYDRNNTGELMARVKDDAGKMWDLFGFAGMLSAEAIGYFIGVVICMLRLNWKLALIPLTFMPVLAIFVMRIGKRLGKIYDNMSEANATLTRVAEENISGVRTVKAFAAEDYEIDRFDEANEKYYNLNCEEAFFMAKAEPMISLLPRIMQTLVVLVGGIAAIRGNITYGVFVAFFQYSNNIVWPIEVMGWLSNLMSSGYASYKKIKKIFKEQPEICEKPDAIAETDGSGVLVFEHVGFAVEDKEILHDISFVLPKGKTLGIMGATGSGKSTIVSLLERFYDVTDGAITIDGVDIRDLTFEKVRSFSSVVSQEVFLFSDTVSENVRFGEKETMTMDVVEDAITKACALEFVEKLTEKYDAVIGERGIGLSGGQKQRLSIARALARKAGVLVLDDATSALDMETESKVQETLGQKREMSKIIIGHRISSVRNADEILILKDGAILERGTHEELMKQKGYYYSTYEAQYGDYRNALRSLADLQEGGEKND